MPLYIADDGLVRLLDVLASAFDGLRVGLFRETRVFAPGDTIADYLPIECSFPGYVRQDITSWASATLAHENLAVTLGSLCTWTRAAGPGAEDVYGYFIVDSDGELLWAELVPTGPVTMTTAGQEFQLAPQLSGFRC